MKFALVIFAHAVLAFAALPASAAMTPQYSYYWATAHNGSDILVSEYITGTTVCDGSCPIGMVSYPHAQVVLGEYGSNDYQGLKYLPNAEINFNYLVSIPVSYFSSTPIASSIGGWVICTIVGDTRENGAK